MELIKNETQRNNNVFQVKPMTSGDFRRAMVCFRATFTDMVMEHILTGDMLRAEIAVRRLLDFNGYTHRARRLRALVGGR